MAKFIKQFRQNFKSKVKTEPNDIVKETSDFLPNEISKNENENLLETNINSENSSNLMNQNEQNPMIDSSLNVNNTETNHPINKNDLPEGAKEQHLIASLEKTDFVKTKKLVGRHKPKEQLAESKSDTQKPLGYPESQNQKRLADNLSGKKRKDKNSSKQRHLEKTNIQKSENDSVDLTCACLVRNVIGKDNKLPESSELQPLNELKNSFEMIELSEIAELSPKTGLDDNSEKDVKSLFKDKMDEDRNTGQDKTITDKAKFKKTIKYLDSDMPDEMQADAIQFVNESLKNCMNHLEMSIFLKKQFCEKYGPKWQCVIGNRMNSSILHLPGHYIFMSIGLTNICLFKVTK